MTAAVVDGLAVVVGLPGAAVAALAEGLQSRSLMLLAIALKAPAWELHLLALHLRG